MGLKHDNQVVEVSVLGAELVQPLTQLLLSHIARSQSPRAGRRGTVVSLIYDAAQDTNEAIERAFAAC